MAANAHMMIDPAVDGPSPIFATNHEDPVSHGLAPEKSREAVAEEVKAEADHVDPVVASYLDSAPPEGPTTTRWEEWAYYLYYNGDSGVGPNSYAATLFQNFITQAGFTGSDGNTYLDFGGVKPVSSVILIINGISFAIMTLFFTTIGSCADYGDWNKWILIVSTVICWASQFGWMGVQDSTAYKAAIALYLIGYITYGITLVFYASVFPRLARNTPKTKAARAQLDSGDISTEDYERVEMLERNRLSNISTAHSNWGYIITLALNLSLLLPLADNPLVDQYTLVLTNVYWIALGLPWFFLQKKRSGPAFPKGERWWWIGWKQIFVALKQYRRLPYTFIYLFSFFLLADGLNTTGFVITIIQNEHIQFSFLQSTYLGLAQAVASTFSCYAFWYFQLWRKISTKRMFAVTNVITVFIPFWGMLGLWTDKVGFHNTWEYYFYNILFGLGQAPYYAYAQTMMSELTPPGYEGMFFGLFGITNRASSLVGPNVCAAIINSTGNNWDAFIFLFILCLLAALTIWIFVNMEKGRAMAVAFSIEERGLTSDVRTAQALVGQDPTNLKA